MSNRTDFFLPEHDELAISPLSPAVFIEGGLCPTLEPVEIVRSSWPGFGSARLRYNSAAFEGVGPAQLEDVQASFSVGQQLSIHQLYNGIPPSPGVFGYPVFAGHVEAIETRFDSDGEQVEIIAADAGTTLGRITVYGQRVAATGDSGTFLAGLSTEFNPGGRGNSFALPAGTDGGGRVFFCAASCDGRPWMYAEAIDYLLKEYVVGGQLQIPEIVQLRALTDNAAVRDLDVTGLSLTRALEACCSRLGLRFKFVPRPVSTGPSQAIVFYRNGAGRAVELNCQHASERLRLSSTNVASMHKTTGFWPMAHKYVGLGEFKLYEATFNLIKGWDPGLENTDPEKFSPATNPDFHEVQDVYRRWCLNEAGDYSAEPYSQGSPFDFTSIFETGSFLRCRRRFRPTITRDAQGQSLGLLLQSSSDGGQTWSDYTHAFRNLPDECGVWLSSDQLDSDILTAAMQGTLIFRITASVLSDERLSAVFVNGPQNSVSPVVEHLVALPGKFAYRKVSGKSIFAGSTDPAIGSSDEADDTSSLYELVRHKAEASREEFEETDINTPELLLDYEAGDRVTTSPDSRDLLGCRGDNRSMWWIERVEMDFANQCTNLKIARRRVGNV